MKNPISMKQIEEVAKTMKLSPAAFWMSKATKMDLSEKHSLCILMYLKQSCCDNMMPYLLHAGQIMTEIVGKPIEVKAICVGYQDPKCRK